jgi:hypothetical protein
MWMQPVAVCCLAHILGPDGTGTRAKESADSSASPNEPVATAFFKMVSWPEDMTTLSVTSIVFFQFLTYLANKSVCYVLPSFTQSPFAPRARGRDLWWLASDCTAFQTRDRKRDREREERERWWWNLALIVYAKRDLLVLKETYYSVKRERERWWWWMQALNVYARLEWLL